jgi:ATP-dependent RNA helicase DeaD
MFSPDHTHPALMRALATRGYTTATPVQARVGEALANADLLVSARTGSGKTVAFGLALARTLLGEAERVAAPTRPAALVVAPTRELALQVARELAWLYADAVEGGVPPVATCVGGAEVRREARALDQRPLVVVGTPGRLCDHLTRGRLDLSELRAVVLDEADEMLDMGFREELEQLLDAAPATRRTLLFSATMPKGIEALAARYQRDALRVAVDSPETRHADIVYEVVVVAPRETEAAVVNVLRHHDPPGAIVFCATREGTNRMGASLHERGFSAVTLSGDLTQAERTRALQALRDGRARVLVATDVAARGLDLPDLALVVHADLPRDPETLLHRSGRTGRAGRKGTAVIVVPASRRRMAERLVREARIAPALVEVPSAESILARDRERLVTDVRQLATEVAEDDVAVATLALAGEAEDASAAPEAATRLVAALVRLLRARLPAPEELPETAWLQRRAKDTGARARVRDAHTAEPADEGARPARATRGVRPEGAADGTGQERPRPDARRGDGPSAPWYRINVGRRQNADPRWLIPIICRRGHIEKSDIGNIRILENETHFQVGPWAASRFEAFAWRPDRKDPGIRFAYGEG